MMVDSILELLKIEAVREYIIKASICYIVYEINNTELNVMLRKYGYKAPKIGVRQYIKLMILCAILAVPYVGVFITIVNILSISQDITVHDLKYLYNCKKDIL